MNCIVLYMYEGKVLMDFMFSVSALFRLNDVILLYKPHKPLVYHSFKQCLHTTYWRN